MTGIGRVVWMGLGALLVGAIGTSRQAANAPYFTDEERARIVAYWNEPGRYQVSAPGDGGPWTVRLTPEASVWFLAYNRACGAAKAPPTQQVPQPSPAIPPEWERWVTAKLDYDLYRAGVAADAANSAATGHQPSPKPLPSPPPLIPQSLLQAAGNPPPFAAAVAPKRYTVALEGGTTVSYTDQVAVPKRYAYFRYAQGVMNAGTPLRSVPKQELERIFAGAGLTPFETHVMISVSRLEGGFDAINTYDTGVVSVGFIQFACLSSGGGSLGALLLREKREAPDDFQRDFRRFGIDVTPDGLLVVVDPDTGAELVGQLAALKIVDDKRLTAVFQTAGAQSDTFRRTQIREAKQRFYPADDVVNIPVAGKTLSCRVGDIIRSEAGMATLFDRKVNRGTLDPLPEVLAQMMTQHNLSDPAGLAAYEREIIRAMRYRTDFLADATLTQPEP
ncbi:MAG: hypothetical protein ACP5VE_13515 [Chthonomonadales bacterium]